MNTKSEIVIDLIARAFGLTEAEEIARLKGYLDLYASTKAQEMSDSVEIAFGAVHNRNPQQSSLEKGTDSPCPPVSPGDTGKEKPKSFMGPFASEKTAIRDRLVAYREKYGVGSYRKVIDASNGELSDADIRQMRDSAKMPMSKWQALDKALDAAEKENEEGGEKMPEDDTG